MAERRVTNPGSALGEAVGKLIEDDLAGAVREVAEPLGCSVRSSRLRNHMGNRHQIDTVVSDSQGRPVILIEPKHLRYKKHNWDKGSRLCVAHYSLRRTYPSIRKSIGVLAGEWTDASLSFIGSFGVEIHRIPFDHMADVLESHHVPFRWEEKDRQTPTRAWQLFSQLREKQRAEIGRALTEPIRRAVMASVDTTLRADPNAPKRIEAVELSIRTTEGEHLVYAYRSALEAIQGLLAFAKDIEDVRRMLR